MTVSPDRCSIQQHKNFRVGSRSYIPSDASIEAIELRANSSKDLEATNRTSNTSSNSDNAHELMVHEENSISVVVIPQGQQTVRIMPETESSVNSDDLEQREDREGCVWSPVAAHPATSLSVSVPSHILPLPIDLASPLHAVSPTEQKQPCTLEAMTKAMDRQKWSDLIAMFVFEGGAKRDDKDSLLHKMSLLTCQGEKEEGTMLHRLILKVGPRLPVRVVSALLEASACGQANIAAIPDSKGKRLPLHMCLLKGCSLQVTKCILDAYPEAGLQADSQGNLPLHYAAMYQNHHIEMKGADGATQSGHSDYVTEGQQESLFQFLLDANPDGARKANHRERWPLHLLAASCWLDVPGSSSNTLMPELAQKTKKRTSLRRYHPNCTSHLLKAAARKSTRVGSGGSVGSSLGNAPAASDELPSTVSATAQSCASSIGTIEDDASTAENDGTCHVVRNIRACIQAYPGALQCPDRTGYLPLHLACNQANLRHDVLKVLIEAYPTALMVETKTKVTPYQLADLTSSPSGAHHSPSLSSSMLLLQYLKECTQQQRKKMSSNPLVRWNMGGISTAATRRRRRRRFAPIRPHTPHGSVDLYHCYG